MKIIILLLGVMTTSLMVAQQSPPHPKFANFVGDAYKMVIVEMEGKSGKKYKSLMEKYGDFVYDYPKLTEIDIPELNFPEAVISEGKFPGIERNTQYAMVLHSKMTTTVPACYEFSLNSDDGSILWIDGKEIVNNDGGHEMTMKKDSVVFDPGTYEVKVWYFQGLADRFGIVLDGKIVGKPEVCPNSEPLDNGKKMTFSSQMFFDSGSAKLKDEAKAGLDKIAEQIKVHSSTNLTITGHTDNVGSQTSNQILSLQRAEAIASALRSQIDEGVVIETEGKGESIPIAANETKEGRSKNRRVEVILQN